MNRAVIRSTGRYFPSRVVPNSYFYEDLGLDTSEEWIRSRTGIVTRHMVDREAGEATAHMCTEAGRLCLERAGLEATDLDGVIVATNTPDMPFPATGCLVQDALGAKGAFGWDVQAACSGFVYALAQAAGMIRSGISKRILVCGADTMSSILDYQDRNTCIIFGDGAGAFLLEAAPEEGEARGELLDFCLHGDGAGGQFLKMPGGGSLNPASHETIEARMHFVKQDGRTVFKHAVTRMADVLQELIAKAGIDGSEIALFVPHQANKRIVDACAKRLGMEDSKVMLTLDRWANTTAGTIPTSFDLAVEEERIHKGDYVVLATFGAGFTWGACLIRW